MKIRLKAGTVLSTKNGVLVATISDRIVRRRVEHVCKVCYSVDNFILRYLRKTDLSKVVGFPRM